MTQKKIMKAMSNLGKSRAPLPLICLYILSRKCPIPPHPNYHGIMKEKQHHKNTLFENVFYLIVTKLHTGRVPKAELRSPGLFLPHGGSPAASNRPRVPTPALPSWTEATEPHFTDPKSQPQLWPAGRQPACDWRWAAGWGGGGCSRRMGTLPACAGHRQFSVQLALRRGPHCGQWEREPSRRARREGLLAWLGGHVAGGPVKRVRPPWQQRLVWAKGRRD